MTLPPAFAAGALYDSLLQGALRQFFSRATFETEATPSVSSDGRLAIEPTGDPAQLTIRWFGSRHTLHVPPRRPFTPHETRLAQAIGSVLAARYRAIFDARLMAQRGDLFRGSIEDRYIGAFLDEQPYRIESTESRADHIATAIEVLRVAALSSYENRPISSGVLLVDADEDPGGGGRASHDNRSLYSMALTGSKSFYRLCDGLRTVFLVSRTGVVLDIVDIADWATRVGGGSRTGVSCSQDYRAHARATRGNRHVSVVLSPTHEIKIFAEGVQMFTFRSAGWHLFDLEAKYAMWESAVGSSALAERLFLTALDLSDSREGALFVLPRNPAEAARELVAPADRLDRMNAGDQPSARQDLRYLMRDRTATSVDPSVLRALATMDGATVMDMSGRLMAVGAILLHTAVPDASGLVVEGARTTAAMTASRFGPVLKVSEDGLITFYDGERIWDI
jgi:hypothetical protein